VRWKVSPNSIGAVILGRYRVTGILGAGGQCTVVLARDEIRGGQVAIKISGADAGSAGLRRDASAKARLRLEGEILAAIASPYVVKALDSGDDPVFGFCLVEEVVRGVPLSRQLVRPGTVMEVEDALAIVDHVARGLEAVHVAGFIMRDLSPSQVMVEAVRDGVKAKLIDLALVRPGSGESVMTDPRLLAGTPGFTAPELALGEPATTRSDVYSLAAIAWSMLAGDRPFSAHSGEAAVALQLAGVLGELPDSTPVPKQRRAPVRDLLAEALSPNPSHRPATPTALAGRLRQALIDHRPSTIDLRPSSGPAGKGAK